MKKVFILFSAICLIAIHVHLQFFSSSYVPIYRSFHTLMSVNYLS